MAASVVAAVLVPRLRAQLLPDGSAAPPFSLVGDDGQRHSLPRRATVLEFFETTCPHCREAAPRLCAIAGRHREAALVGVDAATEGADSLRAYRSALLNGCPGEDDPVLLTDPGAAVTHQYRVGVVPTVYVVDASGRIVYSGVGAGGVDGIEAVLDRIRGAASRR